MTAVAPPAARLLPARASVMARAGGENFPVASALLGRRARASLLAIYGFARLVDDVGDEAHGDRSALLDVVEAELDRIYEGSEPEHPVMQTLAATIEECSLPSQPFRRLLQANRQDQVVTRYETFDDLLGYCRLSAAPVGELVLRVFGAATAQRLALSEQICAGLQIVEHLQDVAEDYSRGRVYLPREDLVRFGCDEQDLHGQETEARRALISFEAGRARALLSSGAPLARTLPLRPRLAVAGFVAGGRAAADGLGRAGGVPAAGGAGRAGDRGRRRRVFAAAFLEAVSGR